MTAYNENSDAPDIVDILINNGVDVNTKNSWGSTPLTIAAQSGTPKMVEFLINNGADMNASDNDGDDALLCAAKHERTEAVKVLLEYGIDTHKKNRDGKTALDYAKESGFTEIVEMLKNPKSYGYATRKPTPSVNKNTTRAKMSDVVIEDDELLSEEDNTAELNRIMPTASTSAKDDSDDDIVAQLAKLKKLRDAELIDEDEYKAKKAELLARM